MESDSVKRLEIGENLYRNVDINQVDGLESVVIVAGSVKGRGMGVGGDELLESEKDRDWCRFCVESQETGVEWIGSLGEYCI